MAETFDDGPRYFEFVEGKSSKFWEIDVDSGDVTVRYGRMGTDGQTKTKSFDDDEAAIAHATKLVGQKTGKGYVEVDSTAAAAKLDFEKQLEEDPDDLATLAVYADWLIEQEDPRGEFIQVQLALENEELPKEARKELKAREKTLLKKHEREWLGGLAPWLLDGRDVPSWSDYAERKFVYRFARGRLDSLHVGILDYPFARVLAHEPAVKWLRELEIDDTGSNRFEDHAGEPIEIEFGDEVPEDARDEYETACLFPLARATALGNVRHLRIGMLGLDDDDQRGYIGYSNHTRGGEVVHEIVKRMPRIEVLELMVKPVDDKALFGLKTLRHLRSLMLYHNGVDALPTLAKNSALSNLERLAIHQRATYDVDSIDGGDIHALAKSKHLKNLAHLKLRLTPLGDEGCRAIVESGLLKQLKSLDLRVGTVTDEGARVLAESPDVTHLERLVLGRNALTAEGIALIENCGVANVVADDQPDDSERTYEDFWMSEGDYE